ncbi:MAG: ThiF family adenylyltransferase [Proteobacteria bacterium]|nr:ThiF family adenylyltransferase [Pseudomonadota bacterium]MBU1581833.1 ThiF family adenylyltransferase [Pseudomonadota bacterium]MBU2452199.1 ThiF family adenylyltransferase [Pseudomonadota bacterium]MBU2627889.1 ThiF family adenylyltransferase [Pseudomonadota bacterium]
MDREKEYINGMLTRTALCFSQLEIDKIRNTTLSIAGLGGVGAITVELFARWGIKKFRLMDMDCYDESNMNRQLFATSRTLGRNKVDVAEERIKEINPYAEIELKIADRVDNDNIDRFIKGAGFIIQNADHPSCKLFYLAAKKYKVPLVNGYATISGGRVQVFNYDQSDCTSFLENIWHKIKYKDGKTVDQMTREEIEKFDRDNVHSTAPSVNFVVNIVGAMIVGETIKVIARRGKPVVYPRYRCFDLFDNTMGIRNSNSIFNPDNMSRLISVIKNRIK